MGRPPADSPLALRRATVTNSRRLVVLGCFALATAALAAFGVPIPPPVFVLLTGWIAAAGATQLVLRRVATPRQADAIQVLVYGADLTLLTAVLLFVGGGWWVGAALHGFIVAFAFASVPRRWAQYVTLYALLTFSALAVAQAAGVVRPEPFLDVPSLAGNYRLAATVVSIGAITLMLLAVMQHTFVRVMRRSQEHYRLLVQSAPDMILRLDADGTVRSANRATIERTGRTVAELLGQPVAELVHPEDAATLLGHVRAAAGGDRRRFTVRAVAPDGAEQHFRATCDPIREEDRLGGVLFVARDVTEQRRAEASLRERDEQLRQAQKLEAVGQLTGGIAHDFNNVLTVILANAQLLRSMLPRDRTDAAEALGDVHQAAANGAQLVRKLMGFSRRAALVLAPIDPRRCVEDGVDLLRRVLPEHIVLQLDLDDGVPRIRADSGAVQQILVNLATNARDAMPDGGQLTVAVRRVAADEVPDWHREEGAVCLEVSDTGVGMSAETRARIFDPFFTTKPPELGTGLGLAMVYGLVRQHGGHIAVESAPGRGTRVRVYLPATEETSPPPAPVEDGRALRGGSETILVVEDDPDLRRTVSRVLERFGYRVLLASDGREALAMIEAQGDLIDLVLTDVVMPRLGGLELHAAVARHGRRLRFVFTSGYPAQKMALTPEQSRHFITKPWTVTDLATKVRATLDEAAHMPPSR